MISPEGVSSGVAAHVSLDSDERRAVDLGQTHGQVVLRLNPDGRALEFAFADLPA
jgi:hypothetical protein